MEQAVEVAGPNPNPTPQRCRQCLSLVKSHIEWFCGCAGEELGAICGQCLNKTVREHPDKCPLCNFKWQCLRISWKRVDTLEELDQRYGNRISLSAMIMALILALPVLRCAWYYWLRGTEYGLSYGLRALATWMVYVVSWYCIYKIIGYIIFSLAIVFRVQVVDTVQAYRLPAGKVCRRCRSRLPKVRVKIVNGQAEIRYRELRNNYCMCGGRFWGFMHQECLEREAKENPDGCPRCHTPWQNLIFFSRKVKSIGELSKILGNWVIYFTILLPIVLTPLCLRFLFDISGQSRSWVGCGYILSESIILYLVLYFIISRYLILVANSMNARITYHVDLRGAAVQEHCRFCLTDVNALNNVHNVKIYPKRYFCNCNEYICETCIKNVARINANCGACQAVYKNVQRSGPVYISYITFRKQLQDAPLWYLWFVQYFGPVFLLVLLIIAPILIPDRHIIRKRVNEYLFNQWWQNMILLMAVFVTHAVIALEILVFPAIYYYLRWTDRLAKRWNVVIEEQEMADNEVN